MRRRPNFFPQNLNFKKKKKFNAGSLEKIQISSTQCEFIIYDSYGQKKSFPFHKSPKKSHTKTECEGTTTTTLSTIGIKEEEEEAHRVLHAEWINGSMKLARNLGANEESVGTWTGKS
jgi:hypothetical protein